MRAFLDTSVLIAVFYGDHQCHTASLKLFAGLERKSSFCAAHSLAEVYSTLTRMPGQNRVPAEQAFAFVDCVRDRLQPIALTAPEQLQCLQRAARSGIVGGATYDALIAACAIKIGADALFTWNLRHFAGCGDAVAQRLRTP